MNYSMHPDTLAAHRVRCNQPEWKLRRSQQSQETNSRPEVKEKISAASRKFWAENHVFVRIASVALRALSPATQKDAPCSFGCVAACSWQTCSHIRIPLGSVAFVLIPEQRFFHFESAHYRAIAARFPRF